VPELDVRLWADPCCPWAWRALGWLTSASARRGVDFSLKLVSLAMIDARTGAGRNPGHRASLAMENVIMAARLEYGHASALPLFRAMGRRIHDEGYDTALEAQRIILESLAEVGMGRELVPLASDPGTGAALLAEHDEGVHLAGPHAAGSPIIAIGRTAFLGPVLGEHLADDDAARLFDAVVTAATTPGFYELKRSRDDDHDHDHDH